MLNSESERIMIENDKVKAAIVPVEDAEFMEAFEDAEDYIRQLREKHPEVFEGGESCG